jgi:uncharacterized small protein (DUF1192 family)
MSTVQELEQRVSNIQAELDDAEAKLEGWQRRRDAALGELEEAFDEDSETYEHSMMVQEARSACNHFQAKLAGLKQNLKRAREALAQAKYDEGVIEVRKVKARATEEIAAVEAELVSTIKELHGRAWASQAEADRVVNHFNSHIATSAGRRAESSIKIMHGLGEADWVGGVLRLALREGTL